MSDSLSFSKLRHQIKHNEVSNHFWDGFEFGAGMLEKYTYYQNDFHNVVEADWVLTETQSVTSSIIDAVGGVLRIPNVGDTENDVVGWQLTGESFIPTVGKRIWFGARFRADEATQLDWLVGLSDTDVGLPTRPSDGIYFAKDDGDTNIDFGVATSSVESAESTIGTFAASTYIKVQFRVTGTGLVEYWLNDILQGSITTNIPATELAISFAHADGDGAGGVDNFDIDYIYCYQER